MGCGSSTQNYEFIDIRSDTNLVPETQVGISKAYYFEGLWGRSSVALFMMAHAKIHVEKVEVGTIWYLTVGKGKMHGCGLPLFERSDGTFMNETVPVVRYIARHNGYWPTNPKDCFECDYIVECY